MLVWGCALWLGEGGICGGWACVLGCPFRADEAEGYGAFSCVGISFACWIESVCVGGKDVPHPPSPQMVIVMRSCSSIAAIFLCWTKTMCGLFLQQGNSAACVRAAYVPFSLAISRVCRGACPSLLSRLAQALCQLSVAARKPASQPQAKREKKEKRRGKEPPSGDTRYNNNEATAIKARAHETRVSPDR